MWHVFMDKNYNEVKHYISCDNPIITDHKIHGVKTLPGVVLIDIVCRTLRKLYSTEWFEFNNVVFKRPVVAAQENHQYVVVAIVKHDMQYDITVTSYDKDNPEVIRENMSCQVLLVDKHKATKVLDVDSFIAQSESVIDLADVYALAHSNGIEHDAFMKTSGKVYLTEQQELMEISLSTAAEVFRDKFYIHPAFLDSATFAGTALLLSALSQNKNEERTPYIPFVIEKIRLNGSFPDTIYVHTNLAQQSENKSDKSDIHYKDICIVDASGVEIAKITRLTTKRIRSPKDIQQPLEATSSHNNVDTKSSEDTSIEAFIRHHIGTLLQADPQALNGTTGFYDLGLDSAQLLLVVQLLEQASGKQFYPTLLFEFNTINSLVAHLQDELGSAFRLESATVQVDVVSSQLLDENSLATFEGRNALVRQFWKQTELPLTGIISVDKKRFIVIDEDDLILVPLTAQYFDCEELFILRSSAPEPLSIVQDKYGQLLKITQQLMKNKSLGHFALQVVASTAINDTLISMLSSLLKTVMQEHAGCTTQLVRFDVEAFESLHKKLSDEIQYFSSDAQEVLYNTPLATRYVRALTECQVEQSETPYKAGGVYVITGGMGGIGQLLTRHLCDQVPCTVVVLSRSVVEKVSQRIGDNTDIHYMQTDVTDQANLSACFHHIRETFGAINGVFHCAAVLNDQLIVSKQHDVSSAVFAPKLQGTVNLDTVTQQDKLDFFVLFSSLAALSGNVGQSDYAAANAFLGAFSRSRNRLVKHSERGGYTVAIDWPYWSEGGMSISQDKLQNIFENSGMLPLPSSQGWETLQRIIADASHSQIGVFYASDESLQRILHPYNEAVDCLETIPDITQNRSTTSNLEPAVCRDIAVVGMAGRFPQSPTIKDFADNLQVGRDCITGTPHERWQNYDFSFAMDDYCDQGGYIDDIEQFDPVFFRLSPKHAISLDPQARLFLETAWQACQDAGLPLTVSQPNGHQEKPNVGVFVGVFWSHYELFSAELAERGSQFALGTSASSVANLVSYCLNLKGPSVALDSMCSSSLSSVHFAVESLRRGECQYALAGGVNLVCHPHKFKFLREAGFLSSDLRCRAFGSDGDGYVPGEGVGAVLLMGKQDALQLDYPIHGVIKGSALNHSGRTAGLSVPEPNAQADVITRALQDADVSAQTISYVEAHGTGTSLGDPVEIEGLSKAYRQWTDKKQFCAIGSVKSNIGHLEAAAGIAGLIKVLLQLKSDEIFPSLYTETLNPLIAFANSPFYVAQSTQAWGESKENRSQIPRRAAVSAFGASGSNAHLIVEAHDVNVEPSSYLAKHIPDTHLVVMSARDEESLLHYVHAVLESLDEQHAITEQELLLSIMYTLQVGREPMACRVAFCVDTLSQLRNELRSFLDNGEHDAKCYFHINDIAELDGKKQIKLDNFIATTDSLQTLASQWVKGAFVPWQVLYQNEHIYKLSLPFPQLKRQSYWLPNAIASQQSQYPIAANSVMPAPPPVVKNEISKMEPLYVESSETLRGEQVSLENITNKLIGSFAQVMFLDEQDINPNLSFADMNLDSVVGVEWVKEINQTFNTQLKASVLYDNPNVVELSLHIYEQLGMYDNASDSYQEPQVSSTIDNVQALAATDTVDTEKLAFADKSNIALQLKASFAEIMMMSSDEVNVNISFSDIGLDSVIGVEWIKTLNELFGLDLKASCIYDHPTIHQLSEHIATNIQTPEKGFDIEPVYEVPEPQVKAVTPSTALGKVALISTDIVADLDNKKENAKDYHSQTNSHDFGTIDSIRQGLIESFCTTMYMPAEEVLLDVPFSEMGLDSVVGVEWVKQINVLYNAQFKASCLYDFPTINTLCDYIASELGTLTPTCNQSLSNPQISVKPSISLIPTQSIQSLTARVQSSHVEVPAISQSVPKAAQPEPDSQLNDQIAVIGMAGRYPGAENLELFWQNLSAGVNSIQQVPSWRWDVERFYDPKPTPGKVYSKWLGAVDDVECFDPLFFNITPAEAEEMDPQQRIFLQLSYHAFEDAGYSPQSLSNSLCGVYLGIMNCDYTVITSKSGGGLNTTANNNAIAAARIAYFFNLKGPAIPIDTACSSSLVAIHLACQALKNHEIDLALAGGVTLYLVPESFLGMCAAGMLAKDGQCKTFDNAADGFVPGEGAGAVVLKRLAQAQTDRDNIQGIILASAINQDGKTNGITSPSVKSQTELTFQLYKRYNIDPSTITYAEMHGTGTRLGDPIELEALCSAFNKYTEKQNYCAIGSVKTNIGHTSGAAGVASIHKVLMSMRYKQLAPSLNFNEPNDHFDFANSPFYVNTQLRKWQVNEGSKRRACVSSFGFSGTNAHIVLQEPPQTDGAVQHLSKPSLIVLSAQHPEQLITIANNLIAWLGNRANISLGDVAHTLQVGRNAMACRVAIVANSITQLLERLALYVSLKDNIRLQQNDIFTGKGIKNQVVKVVQYSTTDIRDVAKSWVQGNSVIWPTLNDSGATQKISLPGFPFLRDKYWLNVDFDSSVESSANQQVVPVNPPKGLSLSQLQWHTLSEFKADLSYSKQRHIILIDVGQDPVIKQLTTIHDPKVSVHVIKINAGECPHTWGREYAELIDQLLNHFQSFVVNRSVNTEVLLQVVLPELASAWCLSGISAALKSLALEVPEFSAQTIVLSEGEEAPFWLQQLHEVAHYPEALCVKYEEKQPLVRRITCLRDSITVENTLAQAPWQHQGVYWIFGGLGGLGLIFARDILDKTDGTAVVILSGRSNFNDDIKNSLSEFGGQVIYRAVDIVEQTSVQGGVDWITAKFGKLNGVLHSAGFNQDALLVNKTRQTWQQLLEPKVEGLINLDQCTAKLNLDLFVAFSSIAAVSGNAGQIDYASANAFMDSYIAIRQQKVRVGERTGLSISINWPYWQHGGMTLNDEYLKNSGLSALSTRQGLIVFYDIVSRGLEQGIVLNLAKSDLPDSLDENAVHSPSERLVNEIDSANLIISSEQMKYQLEQNLKELFMQVTKLKRAQIDTRESFESYGIDSIMITKLNSLLEQHFTQLPKTLFFEFDSISKLTEYFAEHHYDACLNWVGIGSVTAHQATKPDLLPEKLHSKTAQQGAVACEPVAIVGMHAKYPQAANIHEFWQNLRSGIDCVKEISPSRWDIDVFYTPNQREAAFEGKSYSKWGGFLEDFDQFDAQFFKISPKEALNMDPQERLFLSGSWGVLEDAGYSSKILQDNYAGNVGVFAGITKTGFDLYGPVLWANGGQAFPHTSFSSVANRVSYWFNLNGPSIAVDTMCSSSLTAIHLACESLRRKECQFALAGGVNIYAHPSSYVALSGQQMLSNDGKCKSFAAGGNGFVPGEGVGIVLLKLLSNAIEDGDNVYASIRGTVVNHGGRTNGYTVPNPVAQGKLIAEAVAKSGVDPQHISYIEAHGTGTELGDPIEVSGLCKAFGNAAVDCRIGSIKSNIGHLEAAAGVAGLMKVVLQMQHRTLVPTLHVKQPNPAIDFDKIPFTLQTELAPWDIAQEQNDISAKRLAGLSSFGAGGSNAHAIIEEFEAIDEPDTESSSGPFLVLLSGRDEQGLKWRAEDLLIYLESDACKLNDRDLYAIASTLQLGRDEMEHRWATAVSDLSQLKHNLRALLTDQSDVAECYLGQIGTELTQQLNDDEDTEQMVKSWLRKGKYWRVLKLWVCGMSIDWSLLYLNQKPQRISLPTYRFKEKSIWFEKAQLRNVALKGTVQAGNQAAPSLLHPLVHENISNFFSQQFKSRFNGEEPYFKDHVIGEQSILPAVAYLEMALFSAIRASNKEQSELAGMRFNNVVWMSPILFDKEPLEITTALIPQGENMVYFEVSSPVNNHPHCRGKVSWHNIKPELIDIKAKEQQSHTQMSQQQCYSMFTAMGVHYGPAHQAIGNLQIGADYVLAHVKLPQVVTTDAQRYTLHPSILDAAFQAIIGFSVERGPGANVQGQVQGSAVVPFSLDALTVYAPCTEEARILVQRQASSAQSQLEKFNISIANVKGELLVSLTGFNARPISGNGNNQLSSGKTLYFQPNKVRADILDESSNRN